MGQDMGGQKVNGHEDEQNQLVSAEGALDTERCNIEAMKRAE